MKQMIIGRLGSGQWGSAYRQARPEPEAPSLRVERRQARLQWEACGSPARAGLLRQGWHCFGF